MVRPGTPADVDAIAELEAQLFPNHLNATMVDREMRLGLSWVEGDPPTGYVLVRVDGRIADITRLGVRPDMQGLGIGSRLLERVFGLGKTVMLTVRKENLRAFELYRRHGFTVTAHLARAGAFVMQREPVRP